MVGVIAGIYVLAIAVVGGVLCTSVVDMLWRRGKPEAAQPGVAQAEAAQPEAAEPEAAELEAAEPDEADELMAGIASPGPAEDYDRGHAQPSPLREPVHVTTVEDVRAWGERMRAEISAWAQQRDPSPSPPEPAEACPDPPATARPPREARLARRRCRPVSMPFEARLVRDCLD
jgi:hypothetical protein